MIIPIPEMVIQLSEVSTYRFDDFDLDVRNLNLRPYDESLIGMELSEHGEQIEFEGEDFEIYNNPQDSPESKVAKYIFAKDNIDPKKCYSMIFTLINQAKKKFLTYLDIAETEKVMLQQARSIADFIYAQMNEHFHDSDTEYASFDIRPFSRIAKSFGSKIKAEEIYDYRTTVNKSDVKHKIFKGFNKACHTLYKFGSHPELVFSRILEQESVVLKWMKPAPRQFNIYWGRLGHNYIPDFIVETKDKIYMIEVKARNELQHPDVIEKAKAGSKYCQTVSEWNISNGNKAWEYVLVADDYIRLNTTFKYLVGLNYYK
jgi:type III restriction enzyme